MKLLKLSLPVLALLALAACKQETAAPADTAPVSGTSAVSEAGAPAAPLGSAQDAKWQSYQCHDGLALSARYFSENGNPVAEIRFDNKIFKLPHRSEESNEDMVSFGDGSYAWRVSNQYKNDLYKEDNGFLVRQEKQKVNNEEIFVDATMAKNCMPAQ